MRVLSWPGANFRPWAALAQGTPPDAPRVAVASPDGDTPRPEARPTGRATCLTHRATQGRQLWGPRWPAFGSPTEQGLWLRTGLVTRVEPGRVVRTDGGGALAVLWNCAPSGAPPGAGSQLSLAAFRALDVPVDNSYMPLEVFAE